jgi:transcriptional regulator with XRE-family HTH domain
MGEMATRERPIDRGRRAARIQASAVGQEVREARLAAGVSQSIVAEAAGTSRAEISRIERGRAPHAPLARLTTVAAVLGLDLSLRLYPAGLPIRDRGQVALLERLRHLIHPSLKWSTEVPLPIPGDVRAWDASISGSGWTMYVDAETRLRDIQALQRRTSIKQRDSSASRVLLLIADTRTNRAILARLGAPLLPDARRPRRLLADLRAGRDPGGSGVVLL